MNFSTYAGWVIPPDRDILLVADTPARARPSSSSAGSGSTGPSATLSATHAWAIAGYPTDSVPRPLAGQGARNDRDGAVLIDVRFPDEFEEEHVEGAVNIPALDLRTRHPESLPAGRSW